ncbi:MAG: hypothetical protein GY820_48305 [Gammaproteobacteria bacterium]|nr:hypothetical protein [Gammaproteobacteria bacterium]
MVKKITLHEASDGIQHTTHDAAVYHEELAVLRDYVDENRIYIRGSRSVDGADFTDWLEDNPRIYIRLLPTEAKTK